MFPERLKELRESHDLSMDKLVDLYNEKYCAKMNKSTLSRYENGLQDPIYTQVVNLANFFGVSVDYITCCDEKNVKLPGNAKQLLDNYNKLNEVGQDEAVKRVAELTEIEKYTRQYVSANDFEALPVAARSGKSGIVIPTSSKEERNAALDEEFPGTSTPTIPKKF